MKKHSDTLALQPKSKGLKRIFFIILHLYIYTQFSASGFGQELYLEITPDSLLQKTPLNEITIDTVFNDYSSLENEIDSLTNKLYQKGYIESKVSSIQKKNDSVYQINILINKKYSNLKIHLPENHPFKEKDLVFITSTFHTDSIEINFEDAAYTLNYLTRLLTSSGNAFSKLQLQNIRPSATEGVLEAELFLEMDTTRTIDEIHIKGYEKFPRSFLKYAIGLKKGQLFVKEKIIEKSELIENLGFARNIRSPEVLFTEDETEVYLYLEKNNTNTFDGILGFATNEDSGNIELNGYINLVLGNNLNFGEKLILNYKNDGEKQEQFFVKTELPFLLKSPFGLEAELNLFKRDTTFITIEQSLLATYQFNTKTKLFGGYKSFTSENLQKDNALITDIEDFNSRFGVVGVAYNKPQRSRLFPIKTHIQFTNDIGQRNRSSVKTPQTRSRLDANHQFTLNPKNSIYVNSSTGVLFSENYLTNELFRFGGINSIRGFEENSIDASLYSVINTEYRFLLGINSYFHTITDIAYFRNEITEAKSNLYSFGFGLGLLTKAGIFKLNIANGKQDSQSFRFSNTQIHLSLNAVF